MSSPRPVGLKSAIAVVIGNMIGVSIYVSLGFQVAGGHSGLAILGLWSVGAVIALLGALCYAELAAAFPKSGGEYHFLRQAYPPSVGFLSGWIAMVAGFPGPVAMGSLALGQYLIGSLTGVTPAGNDSVVRIVAIVVIVFITTMHCMTLRNASRFHGIFTVLKILLLVVLAVCGFFVTPSPEAVPWMPQVATWDLTLATQLFVSLYYVLYAYSGWNAACYISSEIEQPQRNVPKALTMGIGIVFLLYVALMFSFLRVTPGQALADSGMGAALVAANYIFGSFGGRVVGFFISIALISFISSMTWAGPRVSQRMGQDYTFLSPLARTNAHGIPRHAILLQSAIAIAFLILFDDPAKLMLYVEFLLQISVFLTVLAVIILRVKQPDLPRPIRTWGYPVTPILYLCWAALCMSFFLNKQRDQAIEGLVTLLAGMIVHLLCKAEQKSV